jgi:hypothetical protein
MRSIGLWNFLDSFSIPFLLITFQGLLEDFQLRNSTNRLIFTIKNEDTQMIRSTVLNLIPGDMLHSYVADVVNEDEFGKYPAEFQNKF